MKKNILFYSNHCKYSKEIIQKVSNSLIKDNIIYVCVDDDNIKLPDFITAVPTIYLVDKKRIIMDENILNWMNEQLNSLSHGSQGSQGSQGSSNELQAYFGECNNSFGNNFCNIDNSESKPYISSFTFLDSNEESNTSNQQNQQKSHMDSKLEKLQKSREDFAPIQRR